MKRSSKTYFIITAALFLLFVVFTVLVKTVDVAIPSFDGTSPEVGFMHLNAAAHEALGVSTLWYDISDVMGIFVLLVVGAFALLGLLQWIKRKNLLKVDVSILLLGAFFVLVAACYVLFEIIVINYRPIMVEGVWEASYPSSHTMLVCCVMGASIPAVSRLCAVKKWNVVYGAVSSAVILVTVVGRLLSGVHWLTDIIGGVILSAALVMLYISLLTYVESRSKT
jgi:undecaprenyl-diphosphatase